MITSKYLKELFHYDPVAGVMVWKVNRGSRARTGQVAGTKHPNGYIMIGINLKIYRAHRLIWLYVYGKWPKDQIDHRNRLKDDNRIINLHEATNQQNQQNLPIRKNNTSGVCGVGWDKINTKWRAQIKVENKSVSLGRFDDWFEAVCARKSADNKYGFSANHGRILDANP
ncbi:MAG: HNH endonuclease signature motif containing protein [Betaproteobacteria bacterium]|nr:HNH endonuclease signature motif containing protein [Betaproteobacteria bacterium]